MDEEILQDYLTEARELLEKAQEDTLRLENDPGDDGILASVFRAFHTLKGGAGFLEADNLVEWTHHLEDLLDKLRSHVLPVTRIMIDTILNGMDVIHVMLEELAQGNHPAHGPEELSRLIRELAAGQFPALESGDSLLGAGIEENGHDSPAHPTSTFVVQLQAFSSEVSSESEKLASSNESDGGPDDWKLKLDEKTGNHSRGDLPSPSTYRGTESRILGKQHDHVQVLEQFFHSISPEPIPLAVETQGSGSSTPEKTRSTAKSPSLDSVLPPRRPPSVSDMSETTIRVDSGRLDSVINQVGELVLLRNRLASAVGSLVQVNEDLSRISREMDLTVNDIQNTVMHLRMQPCKRLFQQLPRAVRDASRQLGKEVRLDIAGEEVEIDKTVVDALSSPITHLVRNSLDHGIEKPDERQSAGKPREACIRIAAVHLGDKVRIEVSDNGRGIDRQFLVQKALAKGVITGEEAACLSEQEALELIFRPGFSTKDKATDLSGRGVGMDVVKDTARKLRGHLDVQTRLGEGTTISMEFPLSMAVLPVLYLRLRRDIYALPISAIESLIDIQKGLIHHLDGRTVYQISGSRVTPIVDLGNLFHDRPLRLEGEPVEGILTDRGLFMASEVLGNEDSVVKPIDFLPEDKMGSWYQGATISGKGDVVLILDPGTLISRAIEQMKTVHSRQQGIA